MNVRTKKRRSVDNVLKTFTIFLGEVSAEVFDAFSDFYNISCC